MPKQQNEPFWEKTVQYLKKPTVESGVIHTGSIYYASARTWDICTQSLGDTLSEISKNKTSGDEANDHARMINRVSKSMKPVIVASNARECQNVLFQVAKRFPELGRRYPAPQIGGAQTIGFKDGYLNVLCFDHKNQLTCLPPSRGRGPIIHEFKHVDDIQQDTAKTAEHQKTPHEKFSNEFEARAVEIENSVYRAFNIPEREDYDCQTRNPAWDHLHLGTKHVPTEHVPIQNAFSSSLSGNVPRNLVTFVTDATERAHATAQYQSAAKTVVGSVAAYLAIRYGYNTVKYGYNTVKNLWAKMNRPAMPENQEATNTTDAVLTSQEEQNENIIQIRQGRGEWETNNAGLKFLQGGFFKRDQESKNHAIFTSRSENEPQLRLPLQMLPTDKTITEEKMGENLDSDNGLLAAKVRGYKNKITYCNYIKPKIPVQHEQVSKEQQSGGKLRGTIPPQAQSGQQTKNLQQVMQGGLGSGRTYVPAGRGAEAFSRVK